MIAVQLLRSSHPGPTLVVTGIAAGLGFAVGLESWRVLVLSLTVLLGQASVGLSNDAIDAPRDKSVGRSDKPLAGPNAPIRAAWVAAAITAAAAASLSFVLGWQLALAHAVFMLCGWAYNLGLKATPFSLLCYLIGFGVFPAFASFALVPSQLPPLWALLTGMALGTAIHCTNALPDLDDDRRTGVRGFPHRIGHTASAILAFLALVAGALFVAAIPQREAALALLSWGMFTAVCAVGAAGLLASLRSTASRIGFRLVMIAAALLVLQLLVTGGFAD